MLQAQILTKSPFGDPIKLTIACSPEKKSTGIVQYYMRVEITTELKQRRWRRQRERPKSNMFRLAKQQLCTGITLFCTFNFLAVFTRLRSESA